DASVAPTSRLAGLVLAGTAKGTLAPGNVRDAAAELTLGSARLQASGSAGLPGDRLALTIDAPRVVEVAALVLAAVPRPLAGELHAKGNVAIANGAIGGDVALNGSALRIGEYAAATILARASIGAPSMARNPLDQRALSIDVAATRLALGERTLDAVHA